MVLPVYVYGNAVLRRIASEVDKNYEGLDEFISDLFETMYKSDGVGLAAPQVGKSIRVFVIDGEPYSDEEESLKGFKKVFINPRITEYIGEKEIFNEGCLSIPNIREDVERPGKIRMEYFDKNFTYHHEYFDGVSARIIQHEYDHLDGILFPDLVSPLRKKILRSKLQGISKGKFEASYKTVLPK